MRDPSETGELSNQLVEMAKGKSPFYYICKLGLANVLFLDL